MTFGNWNEEIHNDYEQIKRISFLKRIKPENVTLHPNNTAEIIGTSDVYNVTLNSCTCYDFASRQLPCKHIYRLAFDLGLLEDLPMPNKKAMKQFKDNLPVEIDRYKQMYFDGAISIEKFNKIVNALQSK